MDTREKIIELRELAQHLSTGNWTVVPGLFDPLTAVQAKRISALAARGSKLAAVVLNGQEALLPAHARAALIAGLRGVDLVAIAHAEDWRESMPASKDVVVTEDPHGEIARTSEFVQFVIRRHKSV